VLPYADIVLLTSTSATAIVFGIILSVYAIGERFKLKSDLPPILFIIIGCILIITFANKTEYFYTLEDLFKLLQTSFAYSYFILTFMSLVLAAGAVFELKK
jgi:O-antigen ligase